MRRFYIQTIGLLLAGFTVTAQSTSFDSLVHLPSTHLQVYHSKGRASRAGEIVPRVEKAMSWYVDHYGFKPRVTLLILTEADWPNYTSFPVYGMPHYDDKETLIVAADDNVFWRNNLPELSLFPDSLAQAAKQGYGEDPIRNTMYGVDFDYRNDFPRMTKWLNKLPFYSTRAMSSISAYGEAAVLDPGHASQIGKGGEGVIYIDDFE